MKEFQILCGISSYLAAILISLFYIKSLGIRQLKITYQLALAWIISQALMSLSIHLLGLITGNFPLALLITQALLILSATGLLVYKRKTLNLFAQAPNYKDYIITLIFGLLAYSYYLRDSLFGNPDRIHWAIASSLANNDIYPVIMPAGINFSGRFYHFGSDLLAAILIKTGLSNWDAFSLQTGLWVFAFFGISYVLFFSICRKEFLAAFMTLFFCFFTSSASYEFLWREWSHLFDMDLLHFCLAWIQISWTSISNLSVQLRLNSQNSAIPTALLLIFLISQFYYRPQLRKRLSFYFLITLSSFLTYSIYPTIWYPLCAGLGLLFIIQVLQRLIFKLNLRYKISNKLYLLAAIYLGKFLNFTTSATNLNGVETFRFNPNLYWTNWGKPYLSYFWSPEYLNSLPRSIDHVTMGQLLEIPLFSSISMKDFGLALLIGLGILLYLIIRSKFFTRRLDFWVYIFFSALAAFAVSFLFEFTPRRIEIARFLVWSEIAFVFFISIYLLKLENALLKKPIKHLKKIIWIFNLILFIGLTPGWTAMLPIEEFCFMGRKNLKDDEKAMLRDLSQIHKDRDIVLDSTDYELGSDFCGMAGFYGVGGQIYLLDYMNRTTATYLLNPKLLKELKVNYVFIGPHSKLSSQALKNLESSSFLVNDNDFSSKHLGYKFLRFIEPHNLENYPQDYYWALGYKEGKQFVPIRNQEGDFILAENQDQLQKFYSEYHEYYINNQEPLKALWLSIQAVPKDAIPLSSQVE